MTQPLALVLYERLLPGSQIVNRLQDLNYRVEVISEPERLVECAEQAKPLLVIADLEPNSQGVCEAISQLTKGAKTSHLPAVAFCSDSSADLQSAAQAAGAKLVVGATAILNHLPQLLDQALQIE